ncbi:hypothetical protein D2N39_11685 [Gemmobacter lutimaris]|uniref:Uncharacterized protein n=1 Tax=Gemmobacter lutimaris TaxID=2306023 RepID=A0A398BMF3_9RHOB|nr:hypothetical protein [Gemmobacter lutimaris]RID91889.1 hypothetical protein D2N39_11685 [Gemmobacter lutimaris]
MAENFILVVEGLEAIQSIDELPAKIAESARRAVNDATRRGRKLAADEVLRSVNFPKDYVAPRNGRLEISRYATRSNLEATISARSRNTSLSRFAKESYTAGRKKAGVHVEVAPGSVRLMKGAFLIRLRAGNADLDAKSNLGLAVRTKNGKAPPGYKPTRLGNNLWLLYGPSVAQVLHSEKNAGGVATDISPRVAAMLEAEFWRQMEI